MQVDLLRVLQEGEYRRVGDTAVGRTDARAIAAASGSIEQAVREGKFSEPLFYRLAVVSIELPPLRERDNDILLLARYFCRKSCNTYEKPPLCIDDEAANFLQFGYHWPGNVRELETVIRRVVLLESEKAKARTVDGHPGVLIKEDFESHLKPLRYNQTSYDDLCNQVASRIGNGDIALYTLMNEFEQKLIKKALERTRGNISQAAEFLRLGNSTLQNKMKGHGIKRSDFKPN